MMDELPHRFGFLTRGAKPRSGWQVLSDGDFHDRPDRIRSVATMSGEPPPDWARDLVQVARAVFVVDKRVQRKHAPDAWTRRIELAVQVRDADRWGGDAQSHLEALLGVLTGDEWSVEIFGGADYREQLEMGVSERVAGVALLSGGLDSACYVAAAARNGPGPVLAVGCVDRVKKVQRRIADAIQQIGGSIVLRQLDQRVRKTPGAALELSTRSRGLLYTAIAVYAAAAHRIGTVAVPENGQLAVNPPLTPARLGALSTRSVHPWTLDRVNRLIRSIGGSVEVENPLLGLTKGEVCARGLDAGLTPKDLFRTVSCGRPSGRRLPNCGGCFPCLVRRSGLYHALREDRTPYSYPLIESADEKQGKDLRAVERWLLQEFTVFDLIADMPWPAHTPPSTVMPVLLRGREELHAVARNLSEMRAVSPPRSFGPARPESAGALHRR
jgi:queuosine biosynthesis protein QueC